MADLPSLPRPLSPEDVQAMLRALGDEVRALDDDCHDWYSEGSCAVLGCSAVERDAVIAIIDRRIAAFDAERVRPAHLVPITREMSQPYGIWEGAINEMRAHGHVPIRIEDCHHPDHTPPCFAHLVSGGGRNLSEPGE